MVRIGDLVMLVDAEGEQRAAMVTAIWGGPPPLLTVAYVSDDPAKRDENGRRIEYLTGVHHQRDGLAGAYWY